MPLKKRNVLTQKNFSSENKSVLSLPTNLSVPSNNLTDFSILLYGEKKIGKTTLAEQFARNNKTFFMMTEPGASSLELFQEKIESWDDFVGYVDLLTNDMGYSSIVVDTADTAYNLCMKHVCHKLKIEYPGDDNRGKAWTMLKSEFENQILRLVSMDKGIIFTYHDKLKRITTYTGAEYDKITNTMGTQADNIIAGIIDMWFYYHYYGKKRVLTIEGNDSLSAGRRMGKNHFYTPSGERLVMIDMGDSAEEAFENIQKSWDNEWSPPNSKYIFSSIKEKASNKKV